MPVRLACAAVLLAGVVLAVPGAEACPQVAHVTVAEGAVLRPLEFHDGAAGPCGPLQLAAAEDRVAWHLGGSAGLSTLNGTPLAVWQAPSNTTAISLWDGRVFGLVAGAAPGWVEYTATGEVPVTPSGGLLTGDTAIQPGPGVSWQFKVAAGSVDRIQAWDLATGARWLGPAEPSVLQIAPGKLTVAAVGRSWIVFDHVSDTTPATTSRLAYGTEADKLLSLPTEPGVVGVWGDEVWFESADRGLWTLELPTALEHDVGAGLPGATLVGPYLASAVVAPAPPPSATNATFPANGTDAAPNATIPDAGSAPGNGTAQDSNATLPPAPPPSPTLPEAGPGAPVAPVEPPTGDKPKGPRQVIIPGVAPGAALLLACAALAVRRSRAA